MQVLVIGIGNDFRLDDAVGLEAVRELKRLSLPSDVLLIEGVSDGMALLDCWEQDDHVIIVDAVFAAAMPGTVYRYDALHDGLPSELSFHSTHAFGVAEALELAKMVERLPASLVIYAIEGKKFAQGCGLSVEVEQAMRVVIAQIAQDVLSVSSSGSRKGNCSGGCVTHM
jgi:hydrogenase maturation protease